MPPKKIAKKPAHPSKTTVVELDAETVLTFVNNLTDAVTRSNNLIERLSTPLADAVLGTAYPFPVDDAVLKQQQACGIAQGAAANLNSANQCAPPLPGPHQLPPLDILVDALESKARAMYGFSCHLREQVSSVPPLEQEFELKQDTIKGSLDRALRMMDVAYDHLIATRNVITTLLVCFVLAGVSFGQTKPAAAPASTNVACDEKKDPNTGFTGCEMMRLNAYVTQEAYIRAKELDPVDKDAAAFLGKVVANNPGKKYEAPSQVFPLGRLVPDVPAAPATPIVNPHAGLPPNPAIQPVPAVVLRGAPVKK